MIKTLPPGALTTPRRTSPPQRTANQQRKIKLSYVALAQEGSAEYRFRGNLAAGLGLAHIVAGLGISLNLKDDWRTSSIMLDRTALEEIEDDQVVLSESRVSVKHATTQEHVLEHEYWLCEEGIVHVRSGPELWSVREDVFPNLSFLPRVRENLTGLATEWIEPVKERLAELQNSTASWDVASKPTPDWQSHVTPESQSRRKLCAFVDLDGVIRIFDIHARFTPGAGRIYFRLDRSVRKLIIAHIGRKL